VPAWSAGARAAIVGGSGDGVLALLLGHDVLPSAAGILPETLAFRVVVRQFFL
jgi:hypothetical protein